MPNEDSSLRLSNQQADQANERARQTYRNVVVHCQGSQPYDVYVGRNCRGAPTTLGEWGNPFRITAQATRQKVIRDYRAWLVAQPKLVAKARWELKGKVLACWCAPQLCHGHVLAEIANAETEGAVDSNAEESRTPRGQRAA